LPAVVPCHKHERCKRGYATHDSASTSSILQSIEGDKPATSNLKENATLATLGSVAGIAAAGLGGAALVGGLAIDITDIALVAGLYGVASAVGSSQSAAVRSKGAAGPLFSALLTAADIAKKVRFGSRGQPMEDVDPASRVGLYAQSSMADQSTMSAARGPAEASAAAAAESSKARLGEEEEDERVLGRAARMREELGAEGMQALEDGVAQVMATDVERILNVRSRLICALACARARRALLLGAQRAIRQFSPYFHLHHTFCGCQGLSDVQPYAHMHRASAQRACLVLCRRLSPACLTRTRCCTLSSFSAKTLLLRRTVKCSPSRCEPQRALQTST
jgi:hypothetical protein